jgi:hypothetical protein
MPDSLRTAKVSREGFQTFATLWRNVHSLAVATDLHYNSMGFFRKADFKVLVLSCNLEQPHAAAMGMRSVLDQMLQAAGDMTGWLLLA